MGSWALMAAAFGRSPAAGNSSCAQVADWQLEILLQQTRRSSCLSHTACDPEAALNSRLVLGQTFHPTILKVVLLVLYTCSLGVFLKRTSARLSPPSNTGIKSSLSGPIFPPAAGLTTHEYPCACTKMNYQNGVCARDGPQSRTNTIQLESSFGNFIHA